MPVLRTQRLILSAHTEADLDDCAAMWANPIVTRHLSGEPGTRAESWDRILRFAGGWALTGYGYWAVREAATGRYAGDAGLADRKRGMIPNLDGIAEAGWIFAPWAHGQGFATEALRAALAWADRHIDQPETICLIDAANAASLRVAAKLGYLPRGQGVMGPKKPLIFARPRAPER